MKPLVQLDRLSLVLGARRILDDLSFDIAEGESVALTGPNGSGKTSVLRCLLGLVPFEGRAAIGGHDVVREPLAARMMAAYLPQKPAFGDVVAGEALRFVARVRRIDETRIGAALETVGLARFASARVRTFSGGMQQRLSLASALLTDAPLLLLDEPTASLDREGQVTFTELVDDWRRRGRTLLLASHRPQEIASLTDRTVALDEGRIVGSQSREVTTVRLMAGARR